MLYLNMIIYASRDCPLSDILAGSLKSFSPVLPMAPGVCVELDGLDRCEMER